MQNHRGMRWPFSKKATSNKEEARRFYNAKDYEKAEPFLDAMLKENPNDAWALDVLSRLYMNTGRHGAAVVLLSRALRQQSEPALMRRIVKAGCNSKQLDVVLEHAELLEWTVEDEDLLLKIYDSFWPNERCVLFFHLTEWDPSLQFTSYLQAAYLFENGEIETSYEMIKRMIVEPVKNDATLVVALKVCESLGLQERADTLFDEHFKTNLNASRKRSLAKKLRHAKLYEKSLRVAQFVLEDEPDDEQMLTLVTELATKVDSPSVGINAFHTLDSLGKAKTFHVRRYANAAIAQGSPDDIVKAVQRLIALEADASSTIRRAFTELSRMQAVSEAEKLLELLNETPLQIELEASTASEEGELERALDILDKGLEQHPSHVSFLIRKGITLEALGRLPEAIKAYEQVLELDSGHSSAIDLRLKCGLKIWPEEEYFAEISAATEASPDNLNHQFAKLNYVLRVLKDHELALEVLETCLLYDPENQRAHLDKALVLSWMNRHEEARECIRKLILRWPKSNDVFITASQIEKNAGNNDQQLRHLNSMLSLGGLSPVVSLNPEGAITPEHLATETDEVVDDARLVSIIMTTYKRDPLLDAAIASILNQTYRNIELLIVDDCSPDDNFSYLQHLAEEHERVRVFQMPENGGTYIAKNFGMSQAKGEFIGFMDSDDYSHAERIQFQVASLDAHPEAVGITHDYFRIDESSNIEFRGIGALRMACISLLIRKEVVDEIGFFDSLRVGADTEYIERIEAHFGKERRLRVRIPSMFMMLHSTSLTGGGPFHISWRSVTGHRLQHHRSFRAWHRKIRTGKAGAYVPQKLRIRPFEAPEEMKSTHYGWVEGMPLFSEMIKKRNHDWWAGKKAVWQKELSPKVAGRDYVNKLGLKVPELYWKGHDLVSIPSFEELPNQFVLKPEKGWSSNNVYCMKNGEDLLTHTQHDRDSLISALSNDKFVSEAKPTIMIEELLEPEAKQRDDGLPRDFKFYCFGDEIAMVHVALRKSEINKGENEHQYYTPDFKIMSQRIMEKRDQGRSPIPRPDCWGEMLDAVRTIGRTLGIYMRIDMYATNRGAVFGEFTPTPHGGNGYSEFADRYLGSFWKGEEGVE